MNVLRCSGSKLTLAAAAFSAVVALASGAAAQTSTRPIVLARGAPAADANATTASGTAAVAAPSVSPRPKSSNGATTAASDSTAPASPAPRHLPASVSGTSTMDVDFDTPLPNEKTLHLVVGHSIFIDTKHRLSRVYITNPDVLNSYTSSPNQVVITAKQAGMSNFIVWDEVGDTQVYMVSGETNVDGLSGAVKKAFPMESVDVTGDDGRITLTGTVGTQATADAVGKLASLYAKDVTNALFVNSSLVKQVRLKVRFAEVDRSRVTQFGFNFFGILNPGGNQTLVNSTTGQYPTTSQLNTSSGTGTTTVGGSSVSVSNALNFFLYDFQHQIGATIQDLEDRSLLHILAEPTIVSLSGEKASFLAGGEFPFPIVQGGNATSGTAISIQFKQYGVKLDFTPLVNADGSIDLTVAPEVSALDYTNAVSINGYTIPALSTRRAQTRVVLRSGQTFAISGLLDQRTTDSLGRTPGIANVPILGALFKSKSVNHTNSELVVIVTPELVDPLSAPLSPTIQEPASPIPLLSQPKFDDKLPDSIKKPSGNN